MKRRRFMFWVGFGLFSLSERLRADSLDGLAAALMDDGKPSAADELAATPTHWRAADNATWRWFERETYVDGRWNLTGITTPIHKKTGQPYTGKTGYLDQRLVPAELRGDDDEVDEHAGELAAPGARDSAIADAPYPQPDPVRRARHGRPPSKWLRSLRADELRIFLKKIDVPEAGVEGMTYWTHLTRDHSFDAEKIAGLTIDEQAMLHAAAHFGY